MKKIFFLINIIQIYAFANNITIEKYLFFTMEGSIDKYPITINIRAFNPDDIKLNKKVPIIGYYKYNNINIPIFINGEIDKNGIRFSAFDGKEEFNLKMNSSQLENIINLRDSKKNINLKGYWKNDNNELSLNIKMASPLGDKIHTVYNIYVHKEYKNNTYGLSALYIENLKSCIYGDKIIKQINNTNEIIKKINDDIDKSPDWKKEEIFYEEQSYNFYNNYFNDNTLCFGRSIEYYYGGAYPDTSISYFALDINKLKIKTLNLCDIVNDSNEFRKTLQRELDEYYKERDFYIDVIDKDFIAKYLMSKEISIISYTSRGMFLHIHFNLPHVVRAFDDFEISFDKLKPYLNKNCYLYNSIFN